MDAPVAVAATPWLVSLADEELKLSWKNVLRYFDIIMYFIISLLYKDHDNNGFFDCIKYHHD